MAKSIRVTAYLDPSDLGDAADLGHEMGVTEEFYNDAMTAMARMPRPPDSRPRSHV